MEEPYDSLQVEIRKLMNDYADTIIGGVGDFNEYKRLTGVIEGLALAERLVLDFEKAQREAA